MKTEQLLHILKACILQVIKDAKPITSSQQKLALLERTSKAADYHYNALLAGRNTENESKIEEAAFLFINNFFSKSNNETVCELQDAIANAIADADSTVFSDEDEPYHRVAPEKMAEEMARYFSVVLAPKYYPQLSPGALSSGAQQWHDTLSRPVEVANNRYQFGYTAQPSKAAPAEKTPASTSKSVPKLEH